MVANVASRIGYILFALSLVASAAYTLAELSNQHWAVLIITPALIGAFVFGKKESDQHPELLGR